MGRPRVIAFKESLKNGIITWHVHAKSKIEDAEKHRIRNLLLGIMNSSSLLDHNYMQSGEKYEFCFNSVQCYLGS